MKTQVAIVGAGPAGLLLSYLLARRGIESVVLEKHTREYALSRIRAGVLEDTTVRLLKEVGLGARLSEEALRHDGFELRFARRRFRVPISELTGGRPLWVYGQQKIVEDLLWAHDELGTDIRWEATDVVPRDLDTDRPRVRFHHRGDDHELEALVVAGCDGFHGVSRTVMPQDELTVYQRDLGSAWLGILAEVAPSTEEIIYAYHEDGFAMHSMRSRELSRLYVECGADDRPDDWPDDRVWEALHKRLAIDEDWELREGPVIEKSVAKLRSFVVEPMRYGRLFLAGDAAHIMPPTGAKGLNLAVSDVRVLAEAFERWLVDGEAALAERYSETRLRHVWRVQQYTNRLAESVHRLDGDPYRHRLRLAELDHLSRSEAAARDWAENLVGLTVDD